MEHHESPAVAFIIIGLLAIVYMIPWIVALKRGHHNITSIFLTNLFFGWTLVGWAVSLIWAVSKFEGKK